MPAKPIVEARYANINHRGRCIAEVARDGADIAKGFMNVAGADDGQTRQPLPQAQTGAARPCLPLWRRAA